jgi:hypothetical protein
MVSAIKSTYGSHFNDEVSWLTEELYIDSQQWQHISVYFETYKAYVASTQPPLACISTTFCWEQSSGCFKLTNHSHFVLTLRVNWGTPPLLLMPSSPKWKQLYLLWLLRFLPMAGRIGLWIEPKCEKWNGWDAILESRIKRNLQFAENF